MQVTILLSLMYECNMHKIWLINKKVLEPTMWLKIHDYTIVFFIWKIMICCVLFMINWMNINPIRLMAKKLTSGAPNIA